MTASELISQLSELVDVHGDYKVLCGCEGTLNELEKILLYRGCLDEYANVYLILSSSE